MLSLNCGLRITQVIMDDGVGTGYANVSNQ